MIFLSLFVAFLWSLGGVFQKYVLMTMSPTTLMVVGSMLYFVCIVPYGLINRKLILSEVSKFKPSTLLATGGFVFLSMFFSIILYYRLLSKYDVHKVTAITFVSPLFTLILAALFLKERVTIASMVGVVLIVLGVACIGYAS